MGIRSHLLRKSGLHASSGPPAAPLPLLGPLRPCHQLLPDPSKEPLCSVYIALSDAQPMAGVACAGEWIKIQQQHNPSSWVTVATFHCWKPCVATGGCRLWVGKKYSRHHRKLWPVLVRNAHLRPRPHRPVSLGSQGLPRPPRASAQASFQKHALHAGVLHTPQVSHLSRPGSPSFF